MTCRSAVGVISAMLLGQVVAQDLSDVPTAIQTPTFDARFSLGFNYDLLRDPLQVSFDYPKAYFGLNIPFEQTFNLLDIVRLSGGGIDEIFSDTTLFRDPEEFQPTASARQSPNWTVRVDVPMLWGVASFANSQNVNLSYLNTLGFPSGKATALMPDEGLSMYLTAKVYVPLELAASWETMTFGYAYKFNKQLSAAFNLSRHVFSLDLRATVDVDALGYVRVEQIGADLPLEYQVGGYARAHYDVSAWSPTLAVKFWRLQTTARFGVDKKAKGEFSAYYELPFFVDPYTFQISTDDLLDLNNIDNIRYNATDSVVHRTNGDLHWKLPHGFTFSFDIVRDKLKLSYTKTAGSLEIGLGNVWTTQKRDTPRSDSGAALMVLDTFDLNFSANLDHVFLLSGNFKNFFFNIGAFALDFGSGENSHILGDALSDVGYVMLGDSPLFPVLNLGSALGSRIQLMLELDVLPLLAVKTGVVYYF